jgi:succinyl-CoA synthetase alpha subunit
MSVLINKDTKVICQGFTGSQVYESWSRNYSWDGQTDDRWTEA